LNLKSSIERKFLSCLERWKTGYLTAGILSVFLYGITSEQQLFSHGSQESEFVYVIPKTGKRVSVNGVLNEAVWSEALRISLDFEVRPAENVPPPVKTEVLLIFDDKYLYAGFQCFDPNPANIRAQLSDRDNLGGDDWVGLVLDTFNDQRRAFNFLVTAAGIQYDAIESTMGEDRVWDAIWASAVKVMDWDYAVEIAIPFSSIFLKLGYAWVP
jgi:hypothetical protein